MSLLILIIMLFASKQISALDNGLARTPPMGWLSWLRFTCQIDCINHPTECVSENLYMAMADKLVSEGYRDLGYVFVNIDDCWAAKTRDNLTKQLAPDPDRFPHGMKWLADYMHARGLKLGIYADVGTSTCAGYPGSAGYFDIDTKTFASWGVDSVKLDACASDPKKTTEGYTAFGTALNKTGRPILYSTEWPAEEYTHNISSDYKTVAKWCNIFRNYWDIQDSFDSLKSVINFYADDVGGFLEVNAPGSFNDPDMLAIGDFGLSFDQQRMQMGMWAMFAAPLYMSNDLRQIDPKSVAILQNKLAIAISQDILGIAGFPAFRSGDVQVWTRKLSGGRYAVAVLNFGTDAAPLRVTKSLSELKISAPTKTLFVATDVFDDFSIGIFSINDQVKYLVNPTGIQLLLFVPLLI